MPAPNAYSEADMYKPVKDFFTGLGYAVNAEVMGCDVAMLKDDVLTVIELKKSFNITLLYQAVDRQSITSQVYVAIPRPKRVRDKENALMRKILVKLGLGLIFVSMDSAVRGVEIVCLPAAVLKTPSPKRKKRVLNELAGRSLDVNAGGQTRKPIATAYREKAIRIACALEKHGVLTVRQLKNEHGCDRNTSDIIAKNYYGWFERAGTSHIPGYGLSALGIQMLLDECAGGDFAELIKIYRGETED